MVKVIDQGMADFQNANCKGCKFADKPKVGTGKPCCQYYSKLDHRNGTCYTRKET